MTKARASIAKALARDVDKARLDAASAEAVLGRISDAGDLAGGYAGFRDCAFIIEAVLEDAAVKRALFAGLEQVVSPECILATNTSSLSIAGIGGSCAHGGRVVGVHFFNPAPVMPLVEIIPSILTSPEVTLAVVGSYFQPTCSKVALVHFTVIARTSALLKGLRF